MMKYGMVLIETVMGLLMNLVLLMHMRHTIPLH